METFAVTPIGSVKSLRNDLSDDDWGTVMSEIELTAEFSPESLRGLRDFSHAEITYVFHRVADAEVERGARFPRGNRDWPRTGIFAQRAKGRPNRLGTTMVEIITVEDRTLTVRGLDAIDSTPVIDIKPVMAEFLPRTEVRQPQWSHELMRKYW